MPLAKMCVAFGCQDVATPGLSHCPEHEAARQARIAAAKARAKQSAKAKQGSRLYQSTAWQKAAKGFLAKHPLCADCGGLGLTVAATEVDHITPHHGDRTLFWDRKNWQPLCKRCHSRKTAREVWHGGAGPGG